MASLVPLITTGIAAGSLYQQYRTGKKAEAQASKTAKDQAAAQKAQSMELNKQRKDEQLQLGARRRIMSLRADNQGTGGTLFGGFGGAKQTTLG